MVQTAAYDSDNIFAKILRGEIPNATVYEDDDVLSFMDAFPQTDGHTLVIPKNARATNFLEIDPEALGTLIKATQKVATAVNAALAPDGIRIIQFNGEAAGQSVFHIHFHIIPVWSDKAVGAHGDGQADPADLQATAEKIRAFL